MQLNVKVQVQGKIPGTVFFFFLVVVDVSNAIVPTFWKFYPGNMGNFAAEFEKSSGGTIQDLNIFRFILVVLGETNTLEPTFRKLHGRIQGNFAVEIEKSTD